MFGAGFAIQTLAFRNCNLRIAIKGIAIVRFLELHLGISFELIAFVKLQLYNLRIAIKGIAIMRVSNCIPEWHFWELQLVIAISFFQNCNNIN